MTAEKDANTTVIRAGSDWRIRSLGAEDASTPSNPDGSEALKIIHALLQEYDGSPSNAGDAFKIVDAALQSRPAEPAGEEPGHQIYSYEWGDEPVAWMYEIPGANVRQVYPTRRIWNDGWTETPLYARPAPSNPDRLVEAVQHLLDVGEFCRTDDTESALRRVRAALSAPALDGEKGE